MARFPNIPFKRRISAMAELMQYEEAKGFIDNPRYALDSRLHVTFYKKAVLNRYKSDQEGRPIFDEKDYVRIITPGDTKTIIDCPVAMSHRQRFHVQWDRYNKNQVQSVSGTPLEAWPQMSVGQVAELKAMNVSTVEQLASMPDNLAQRIMGSHELRRRAQAYLDAAASESHNSKLAAELEKRDSEIAALKIQMEKLMSIAETSQQSQSAKTVTKQPTKE